jgi:hypothetical protein
VFVVKGVRKGLRRTYKLWDEGVAPCVVIEMTSRSTRLEDKGNKRALYALLGVREYFLFDPLGEYLKPPLQGFTLVDGEYAALPVESDGGIISRELGLKLYRDETVLRLFDLASGREVVRTEDLSDVLQQTLARVQGGGAGASRRRRRVSPQNRRSGKPTPDAVRKNRRVSPQNRRSGKPTPDAVRKNRRSGKPTPDAAPKRRLNGCAPNCNDCGVMYE